MNKRDKGKCSSSHPVSIEVMLGDIRDIWYGYMKEAFDPCSGNQSWIRRACLRREKHRKRHTQDLNSQFGSGIGQIHNNMETK